MAEQQIMKLGDRWNMILALFGPLLRARQNSASTNSVDFHTDLVVMSGEPISGPI